MNSKTNTVRAILLDASECDRPEAVHPTTIEICADDLQRILERHITEPAQCLHQIAEPAANLTSELADMLERSITGLGHYRNTDRWSEADEEHIHECNALLERFNSSDDEHEAAPQAVQPAVPVLFVSREQLQSHTDHLASEAGRYLPARKTAVGKFTMPLYAHPAEGVPAQAFKTKVYQALGIGSACNEDAVFVNIENARRRADCLSAIEREFFMVETPPDESEGDTEPGEECLLNWGHAPTQYVQQFAKALAATQPAAQGLEADGMYYLQDARHHAMVGNCPSFWREGGGYTTNLDEAEHFTLEAAMKQHKCRETDLPWLCSEVDKLRRPTVDCQYMPRSWDAQRVALAQAAKQGAPNGQ